MNFLETDLGFEFTTEKYLAFFGKKNSSLDNLKNAYPHFNFKLLHQVHGNELLHTDADSVNDRKADAHWTTEKNVALISKSADCIPVLAFSEAQNQILAIHAGWRGVQNRIIPKSLSTLGHTLDILIGPHITKNSFDIQTDCLDLLKQCTRLDLTKWFLNGRADLDAIILDQIEEIQASKKSIRSLVYDTKTDLRFHSHRRDRDKAGRQNSFIVLLN